MKPEKRNYPRIVFAICAFVAFAATMPARADLGDTYALSCQRYGTAGMIDKADGIITWDGNGEGSSNK
jgi:hypothetical protein